MSRIPLVTLLAFAVGLLNDHCRASPRPNVIIVMTDDQGYGEFSCHGNPIARTPNIDRLASQSIRLTDFHVAPMCTPTRGQLLTGLDAFRNGAINVSSGRTLLRPELETIADVFRHAGYRTGLFGKWHLGDNYPFRPEDRGFDETLWFPSSHINSVPDFWDNDYFDDTYIRNGQRIKYQGYCTDLFFREAIRWMDCKEDNKPFLLYLPLNAAHWPWFVPEEYRERVRHEMQGRENVIKHLPKRRREALVSFLAMGANIDDNIGRLDQFLSQSDLMDDTVVVFLTDNGSTMGPSYFNAGMRGSKTTLWEGGHRVPCFIRWPRGGLGMPREIAELTHVQDLLPTLAELASVRELPTQLDGASLVPILRGDESSLADRMLVINYSRMPGMKVSYTTSHPALPHRDGAAVLWKRWRLLENRALYNLDKDPRQERDVAASHPAVVQRLRSHLDRWWAGLEESVAEPQRVIIGSPAENPSRLTACEWLDVFVDQQVQIRRGVARNGTWHLQVDRPGHYDITLRRWPKESSLRLDEGVPAVAVSDGTYVAGTALPITHGRVRIGTFDAERSPEAEGRSIRFATKLDAGPIELKTWFLDAAGNEICGAYYVTLRRRDDAP